jgi:Domain of unknown function (DUF6946)
MLEPEDVVRHLGKQEKHWKEGRSAHALTVLWSKVNALPPLVETVLKCRFQSPELIDAFLERQTDLGSDGRASQTDLLAIVGIGQDLAIVAVEGKAGEPFDKRVEEWLRDNGKKDARLTCLCETLGLSRDAALPLRYQLLHRSVSAVLEARRYRASVAMLLVHSFKEDKKGFADFASFLKALGLGEPTTDALVGPVQFDGTSFYAHRRERLRAPTSMLGKELKRMRAWCDERRSKP